MNKVIYRVDGEYGTLGELGKKFGFSQRSALMCLAEGRNTIKGHHIVRIGKLGKRKYDVYCDGELEFTGTDDDIAYEYSVPISNVGYAYRNKSLLDGAYEIKLSKEERDIL